jgi:hypothetical protein
MKRSKWLMSGMDMWLSTTIFIGVFCVSCHMVSMETLVRTIYHRSVGSLMIVETNVMTPGTSFSYPVYPFVCACACDTTGRRSADQLFDDNSTRIELERRTLQVQGRGQWQARTLGPWPETILAHGSWHTRAQWK